MLRRLSGLAVLLIIVFANLGVWWLMNQPASGIGWHGGIKSISFSPYRKDDNPFEKRFPPPESIDSDLALIASRVHAIRLYNAGEMSRSIPPMAAKYGLKVTASAWIEGALGSPDLRLDKREEDMSGAEREVYRFQMRSLASNEEEIDNLVRMAQANANIDRVIVGNETLLTARTTPSQLIRYIREVKSRVNQPVSTAEPASEWLRHPELVREVDFITLHVLPYWEGVPIDKGVDYVLGEYRAVKETYPEKHVVIGEVGWPSAGKNRGMAEPSVVNQALFTRQFLNVVTDPAQDIDYNIIEAFDQPWKRVFEWGVGTHWGLWDADRRAKFSMVDPVLEIKNWPIQAIAATILALIPMIWFVLHWPNLRLRGKIFFTVLVQAAASLVIWTMSVPVIRDFAPSTELLYSVLMPAQLILLTVVLIAGYELTQLTWALERSRDFQPETAPKPTRYPKVSLHLPCYNEPPDMLKETLNALAALDYPNFEVLVLDNNTKDPAVWRPILEHCEVLGERFHFYHLGQWKGAKSGALNFGLTQTAADAEIVGVIDSDYVVDPDWLSTLTPYFENPKVGWVQAPQDHRSWENDLFKEAINWEYAGFFDIGMVARNEDNAIIQHGTMTLIRKKALLDAGDWAEWTICEDAELGLRLLEAGYESVYLNHRFGRGVTPDNFTAYKKQRYRWAYGAVQILKGHWRQLNPFKTTNLSARQKYHFITGWLPWFADGLYVLFSVLSVLWTIGLIAAPQLFDFPLAIFVMPTIGVFVAKFIHHIFLYSTRVKCNWRQRIGSAIAGMGLTYSIGRAMWAGVFTRTIPFLRTPKMEDKAAWTAGLAMAPAETFLMLAQLAAAFAILYFKGWNDLDARMWALVLTVQAIPYAASLMTAIISAMPTERLMRWLNGSGKNKEKALESQT